MNILVEKFNQSEKYIVQGKDIESEQILLELIQFDDIKAVVCYRLGQIYNRMGRIDDSIIYHEMAFHTNPALIRKIVSEDHPNINYIYSKEEETLITDCPLCSKKGVLHSCYNVAQDFGFIKGFNPVKVWMYCKKCHHIYTNSYPKNIQQILSNDCSNLYIEPKTYEIQPAANIISKLKKIVKGNSYLEVGVGTGVMLLIAKEYGFNVEGIDIRSFYAEQASRLSNTIVHSIDYHDFLVEKQYDVIVMGDVLEHVVNPVKMIEKTYNLLSDEGILWISTPNFDSAYPTIMKDKDPMWWVTEHINYFSFNSLQYILNKYHFKVIDYHVSSKFNGSMEVIAQKTFSK
ncbi:MULTISPECIES: class I SAM-dependent methyltransferase [Bacillus]|uniref:Class I SAM-dependent methyltransferase n=1 Tax=Bacillus cereus TaxID=1396 RepID=A0A9X6GCM4_BACCE|nr:class I SAM-dependent methyltransferase [Bacillus cereus]OOR71057.1 hypothetical protein BLX06_32910 [Bacillus cereus]